MIPHRHRLYNLAAINGAGDFDYRTDKWKNAVGSGSERRVDAGQSGGTPGQKVVAGAVMVTCWCEKQFVWISQHLVGDTTESCGRPGCKSDA